MLVTVKTPKYKVGVSNINVSAVPHTHSVSNITDFNITTPVVDQVLKYNGTKWVNSDLVLSTPVNNLSDLTDTNINTPVNNQVLKFDGNKWVNHWYHLYMLEDVVLSSPSDNQVLKFISGQWINSDLVLPSDLNSLTDVALSSPTNNQVLKFDGTNWVNGTALTSIDSVDVVTALGYTPYDSMNPSGFISGNQTITLSGDISGSGDTSINVSLTSVVAPGTSTKVTYDAKGRVTFGDTLSSTDIPSLDWSKITTGRPATLGGYGITDAQPLSDTLTNLTSLVGNGLLRKNGTSSWTLDTNDYLTTNETITLSGDITGTGTTSITTTLGTVPVTKGGTGLTSLGSPLQVLRTNASANGMEWASVSNGSSDLDSLTDVVLSSPSNNQVLKFDGTNWVNGSLSLTTPFVTIDSLSDNPTTPSSGKVNLFAKSVAGQNILSSQNSSGISEFLDLNRKIGIFRGWWYTGSGGGGVVEGPTWISSNWSGGSQAGVNPDYITTGTDWKIATKCYRQLRTGTTGTTGTSNITTSQYVVYIDSNSINGQIPNEFTTIQSFSVGTYSSDVKFCIGLRSQTFDGIEGANPSAVSSGISLIKDISDTTWHIYANSNNGSTKINTGINVQAGNYFKFILHRPYNTLDVYACIIDEKTDAILYSTTITGNPVLHTTSISARQLLGFGLASSAINVSKTLNVHYAYYQVRT